MKISNMPTNPTVLPTDIIPISKGDASASYKTPVSDLADFIAGDLTYQDLDTNAKDLIGAINEAAQSGGGGVNYVEVTGTLTAGNTSITLNNGYISDNCTFDFYTSKFGVNPTDISVSNGSITLTFDEQEENINVKVRLYDYIIPILKNYAKFNGTGINLPFMINSLHKLTLVFYQTSTNSPENIIGNSLTSGNDANLYSHLTVYQSSYYTSIGSSENHFGSYSSGEHIFIENNGNNKLEFDGVEVLDYTPTDIQAFRTIGIQTNAGSPYCYLKEYKIESTLTGDVICDLKPAIVNNVACLFDLVSGDIYTATNMTVVDTIPNE